MTYRTAYVDPDYRRDPKTKHFCARCQKDIKPGSKYRIVHLVDGGINALHPDDESVFAATPGTAAGDCGAFPVGMDCARIIGLAYSRDA